MVRTIYYLNKYMFMYNVGNMTENFLMEFRK